MFYCINSFKCKYAPIAVAFANSTMMDIAIRLDVSLAMASDANFTFLGRTFMYSVAY